MEALVLQLTNTFQHKCRIYLEECLEEFAHRYESFQRETIENVLRDCIHAARRLNSDNALPASHESSGKKSSGHEVDTDRTKTVGRSPTHVRAAPGRPMKEEARPISPQSGPKPAKSTQRRIVAQPKPKGRPPKKSVAAATSGSAQTSSQSRPRRRCAGQAIYTSDEDLLYAFIVKSDSDSDTEPQSTPQPPKRRRRVTPKAKARRAQAGRRRATPRSEPEVRETISAILGGQPGMPYEQVKTEVAKRLPHRADLSLAQIAHHCRGLFYALDRRDPPTVDNGLNVGRYRHIYVHWFMTLAVKLPRVVYVDECIFNVRGKRRAAAADNMALLLAISPQGGHEQHLVTRAPVPPRDFEGFVRRLVDGVAPGGCAFIFNQALRERMPTVRQIAANHCVQMLPPSAPDIFSPMAAAVNAWRGIMLERLSRPGVQSLLMDVSSEAARPTGATAQQLRAAILTEHAEAALAVVSQERVARWHEACRRHFLAQLVDG